MGSKARIVHEILPIMLDKEHDTFVDAFCGGCSVIENVPDTYRRIANDKNKYLIEMWKHLQDGGFVFSHISKETYDKARDCYHGKNNFFTEAGVGLIGFMASFNGRFFDGGYSGLYICESGSYHRLLYTPNKGYVRHGEPDVDEDFTLDIEEESFSSYVMTLDQSWYKLGNVYAGIGFLKEKE